MRHFLLSHREGRSNKSRVLPPHLAALSYREALISPFPSTPPRRCEAIGQANQTKGSWIREVVVGEAKDVVVLHPVIVEES